MRITGTAVGFVLGVITITAIGVLGLGRFAEDLRDVARGLA